jgi:hypothetical protein
MTDISSENRKRNFVIIYLHSSVEALSQCRLYIDIRQEKVNAFTHKVQPVSEIRSEKGVTKQACSQWCLLQYRCSQDMGLENYNEVSTGILLEN